MHLVCETVELGKGVTVNCPICKQSVCTILINVDTGKWYCPNCDHYLLKPNIDPQAYYMIKDFTKEIARMGKISTHYAEIIDKILDGEYDKPDLGVLAKHGD